MLEARTSSIFINHPWRQLYDRIWQPETFPGWASGLSKSHLQKVGNAWRAQGPDGPVSIRFTDYNEFGIMDHYVDTGTGAEISVPLRIIPNGHGAEVLLTVFRQPGMSDEKFSADIEWVERDLRALRTMCED